MDCTICDDLGYTTDDDGATWVCDCPAALRWQWERDDPLPSRSWAGFERHVAAVMG